MEGVVDYFIESKMFLTSFLLPIKGAGKGAYKFSGLATMLDVAVAKKKSIGIRELDRDVSVLCWKGKQLSSNVTSLDNLTEQVCLFHSQYPFELGSYPTSVTSIAFASNLHHLSMGMYM